MRGFGDESSKCRASYARIAAVGFSGFGSRLDRSLRLGEGAGGRCTVGFGRQVRETAGFERECSGYDAERHFPCCERECERNDTDSCGTARSAGCNHRAGSRGDRRTGRADDTGDHGRVDLRGAATRSRIPRR